MNIFLSYRRTDSVHALWLYPWLIQLFGRERVFWDRKDIEPGANFTEVLEKQIQSSNAFISLVSNDWLHAKDDKGSRRIDSPDDWIRRETAIALRERIRVIPVLVGGMKWPADHNLPEDLQTFAQIQMLSTADMLFYDLLREALEKVMPAGAQPLAPSDMDLARLQRRAGTLLRSQIQRLQVRAAELIDDRKLDRAKRELDEGSELLMALLEVLPGDPTMDAQLAYLFGTSSQTFAAAGDKKRVTEYQDLAITVFQRLLADPQLSVTNKANTIKGIGAAFYERGDPVTAIQYYRKALELNPAYSYAWHDLFLAYDKLATRGAINVSGMRTAIDKARETGLGQPGLGADKFEKLEALFTKWQQQLAHEPLRQAEDGEFRLVPTSLVLVIGEAYPNIPIFNFDCNFAHLVAPTVTVRKMDAEVITPQGSAIPFHWTVFYNFRPLAPPWNQKMTKTGDAHEFEIAAGSSSLGVQFMGPEQEPAALWASGQYRFTVSVRTDNDSGDWKTSFSVSINSYEAGRVKDYSGWKKTDWDRWKDPDHAIGIPLIIDRSSFAMGA